MNNRLFIYFNFISYKHLNHLQPFSMMKFPHRLRHFEAAQMDAQQCLQLDDGHIKAAVRLAKASKVNWRKRRGWPGDWRGCRESEVKGVNIYSKIQYICPVRRRGASLVYQNFWVWSILWCSTSDIFGYFTSRIPRIRGITISGQPSLMEQGSGFDEPSSSSFVANIG